MRFFDFFMLLGWPVVTLLVSGLGFYLMRRLFDGLRNRALPAGRTHRLVHSIGAPILGLPALLICGHFALTNFHSGETVAAVMLTFFASLGLLMIAEFIFARHELFDGGIRYNGLVTCQRTLRWADVVEVRYSLRGKWFRLKTRNQEVVRIAGELRGLPYFAAAVLAQVAPEALDEPTRSLLAATAEGKPLEIWD